MENSKRRRLFLPTFLFAATILFTLNACGPTPAWQTDPASLTFAGQVGEDAPATQALTLKNSGGGSQPFKLSANASWVHATPTSGDLDAGETVSIQVSVDACTEAGEDTATLNISGAANASVSVSRDCAPASGTMLWVNQFGGEDDDEATDMVVDATGNAYVLVESDERVNDVPIEHLFVVKFDSDGTPVWTYQVDSIAGEHSFTTLAITTLGEVYVIGKTEGDFGNGNANIGGSDALLLKLSSEGALLWARQFGSTDNESASELTVDENDGRIYITGLTYGDFADPDAEYSSSTYFLAAYGANGEQQWAFSFDRSQDYAGSPHLALDPTGNLVVSGNTFNPTEDVGGMRAWDVFVDKYSPTGTQLWRYDLASDDNDLVGKPLVDAEGKIYAFGKTDGTLPDKTSQGNRDAYAIKLSPEGSQLWLNQFGTGGSETAGHGALDSEGNVYLFGMTSGAFPDQTLQGDRDPYLAKLDGETGVLEWATQFGTTEYEEIQTMGLSANGRLVVSGRTEGSFPGYTLNGRMDPYVATFDTSGNQLWLVQFSSQDSGGTENRDWLNGFGLDAAGNVYLAGQTQGVYPGETPFGEDDAFLIKFQH